MKAMILAAGLGTRLQPLTNKLPKPAIPFLNIPMIYYAFSLLEEIAPEMIVVNTHHLPQEIEKLLRPIQGTKIQLSPEIEAPLGSGGGIWKARQFLEDSDPFITLNGDAVILPLSEKPLQNLLQTHLEKKPLATLLGIRDPRVGTEFNGLWVNTQQELVEVTKRPSDPSLRSFHFTGVQILSPKIFQYLPKGASNIFQDAILPAIKSGERVIVREIPVRWYETGDVANFILSTEEVLKTLKKEKNAFLLKAIQKYWPQFSKRPTIWQGVDSEHAFSSESDYLLMGNNSVIHPSVRIKGFAVLGNNVSVGPTSKLENAVILDNVKVPANTRIKANIYF